ncbi:30S ribosomal protein S9 [Actinokineospora iranica]|uniref:Small ribosomal subunit protein uS9 n=1 Tax=Actinokineospora iranica TaxID=1271860 RepID=A0A1G6V2T5_9PSEU|nr:30S ribosomal protein S9 [Actinokineospora iranica]SDD47929.1 SSU ribosomal protein S9P [Actinokineospora iranica]
MSQDSEVTAVTPEIDEAPEAVEAAETEAPETDAAETVEAAEAVEAADESGESSETDADDALVPALPHLTSETAQTVGRRKQAIVRVRILPGSGKFLLNGKSLEEYFPNKVHQQLIREPLVVVEKPESFDIRANLHGGGITGQAGALRLAIARALIELDSEDRPVLKKAGFLTRDPRAKERKKYGLKKARKAPQYSKR